MSPRIALIHATPVSIEPIGAAFRELWPEASPWNLLDDSLSTDLQAAGSLTPAIRERFLRLGDYCAFCGVDAILFTCSAFGEAIEGVQARLSIPVLKPNEAMIEEALESGRRIGMLATADISIRSMRPEFETAAAACGVDLTFETAAVPDAMQALLAGDRERHDALIVKRAASLTNSDVLALTQFSMAHVAARIAPVPGRRVLTTPASAIARLRSILDLKRARTVASSAAGADRRAVRR
jgi:Asp/Glu/hydantoin racemase